MIYKSSQRFCFVFHFVIHCMSEYPCFFRLLLVESCLMAILADLLRLMPFLTVLLPLMPFITVLLRLMPLLTVLHPLMSLVTVLLPLMSFLTVLLRLMSFLTVLLRLMSFLTSLLRCGIQWLFNCLLYYLIYLIYHIKLHKPSSIVLLFMLLMMYGRRSVNHNFRIDLITDARGHWG